MAILQVIRKGNRRLEDSLYDDIKRIWDNPNISYRDVSGIPGTSTDDIMKAFNYIQSVYYKQYGVRSHLLRLIITEDMSEIEAWNTLEMISEYIGEQFQNILTMKECDNGYVGSFLVNAVNFNTGERFQDNNQQYINLRNYILQTTNIEVIEFKQVIFNGSTDDAVNYS